jgi:hypothetical protein
VLRIPKRADSRPEKGETIPAVMGPGAMQAAACRTEKCHCTVSSSVVPKSVAAKPL